MTRPRRVAFAGGSTMGIRESIKEKPRLVAAIAGGVVVFAVAFIVMRSTNADSDEPWGKAFFTVDDGTTWFVDDATKLAPFQRDGKEAVRAYVFECDGKAFVNHVERFTPEGRKAAEASTGTADAKQSAPVAGQLRLSGAEVKKPGAKQWTPLADLSKAGPILRPTCPGGAGEPKPVQP